MKRSDISDAQVVAMAAAFHAYHADRGVLVTDRLCALTGAPEKVAYAALERAYSRGLIECGVSIRTAWPTAKGLALLTAPAESRAQSEAAPCSPEHQPAASPDRPAPTRS